MGTIGAEWVNKYHGRGSDLSYCDNDALGFFDKLDGTRKFAYGNDSAYDEDFEHQDVGKPPAGTDSKYADNVDIMYFAGHANEYGFYFGRTDFDNGAAKIGELKLGQKKLKWLVLSACEFLKYDRKIFSRMKPVFSGLHYILGFYTICSDSKHRGEIFASKLNSKTSIRNAWLQACIETESSDTVCALMRVKNSESNTYNDHWIGKGYVAPDPRNFDYMIYYGTSC